MTPASPLAVPHAPVHDDPAQILLHGSLKAYLYGFVLAALLTIAAFWLVIGQVFTQRWLTIGLVLLLAIAQMAVHIHYFLHLDSRSEGGWNMLAFIFAGVLVVIVLGASIWAIYQEDHLMMPTPEALQQVTTVPPETGTAAMPGMPGMADMPGMAQSPNMAAPQSVPSRMP